jgi:DNA adenine methylase
MNKNLTLFDDATAATITAICPWFGGKRTLAPRIITELGKHSAYWEPFCGSMAVLLQKPESSHETVNDLHADLINLARVIADEPRAVQLYSRLSMVFCDEHRRAESVTALLAADDPIDRAFHYFIVNWFGRNGFSGTAGSDKASFAVRWTPNGGHGGQRFSSAVNSIPSWHQRLRRVTILNRNAFGVIEKIDDHPRVVIYVDPPYVVKNAKYEHDFAAVDHDRLATLLKRFKAARVVISYYDHPIIRGLYDGWTFVDCTITKGLHNAGKRGQEAKAAPEVLIINGPSYAKEDA